MLRVIGQAGIVHARDRWVGREQVRDAHGAGALGGVANEIGLEPALNQKCRVWVQCDTHSAEVGAQQADQLGARNGCAAHDVAGAGGVLGKAVNENIDIELAVLMEAGEGVVHYAQ